MSKTEVNFTSNKKQVLSEFQRKLIIALNAIGMDAEKYASEDCPVDTGRLRNSITYATAKFQGEPNKSNFTKKDGGKPAEARSEDYKMRSIPEENAVYIGTNVVYAAKQEYGDSFNHTTGKAHFLRDAASTHKDEYKKKVKEIMES